MRSVGIDSELEAEMDSNIQVARGLSREESRGVRNRSRGWARRGHEKRAASKPEKGIAREGN